MRPQQSRLVLWSSIAALLLLILLLLFWPKAIITDMAQLSRGSLKISISDEGKTRIHDIYTLSAPVSGHLRRIDAEVGDPVLISDTVVAQIEPLEPGFLDPRSEAQAKADIQTAKSALSLAQAEVNQAQAEIEFALAEFNRITTLRNNKSVSERELDNAQRTYKSRRAIMAIAQAALQMRKYQLQRSEALLLSPTSTYLEHDRCECMNITAPVSGRILKILNKSEGVVKAGTPLLEIGNPEELEIVAELLSFDAISVEPGQHVLIKNWGGAEPLSGRVKHVEPIGFNKVSALGIEEQRVNVVIELVSDFSQWSKLGHGYQVDVDIVIWQENALLTVPITALFREQQQWAIFVANNNVAEKRLLQIGRKNAYRAQIISGMEEDDWFILYPNEQIEDGVKVVSRSKYID